MNDRELLRASKAREAVKAEYPTATSTYTGTKSAEVYVDRGNGVYSVLGAATAASARDAVELAWIDAAERWATDYHEESE